MSAFLGVARYEFQMQARRPTLWLALALTCGLVLLILHPVGPAAHTSWSVTLPIALQLLLPIVVAILLSDRLTRDGDLRVHDLIHTTGISIRARVWGKYVGAVSATSLAALAIVLLIVLGEMSVGRLVGADAARDTLVGFLLMALPAYLFIGACGLLFPSVMPPRLYQILFACFWLWEHQGRVLSIRGTPLASGGPYAQKAYLSLVHHQPYEQVLGPLGFTFTATPAMAGLNIGLLLAMATLALFILEFRLRWTEARR